MKSGALVLLVLMLFPAKRIEAEDWIGLDPEQPMLAGVDLGQDQSGDSAQALLLGFPLGDSAGFNGYYSQSKFTDEINEFDSLSLASAVWIALDELVEVELQHFFEGNGGELEKQTLGIALGLRQGEWRVRVQIDNGEALLFTRNDDSDFFDQFVPDRFSSAVSAIGVSLAWQRDTWYWQASYQRYDYEKDLSALERSRFARFVVKESALAQSSLLISKNASLVLGRADLDNDYWMQLSQDQSAIDDSYTDTLSLNWQHWASEDFGYLFNAAMPLPADDGIGLTLGLRWML